MVAPLAGYVVGAGGNAPPPEIALTVSCEGDPRQILAGVAVAPLMMGVKPTPMEMEAEATQPVVASLAVTVYVVLEEGRALTTEPLVALRPVAGDQVYA